MTPAEFKAARQSLDLSADDCARLVGYGHRARIYEVENGKRNPSDTVCRLMQAYLSGYRPDDWPA